MPVDPTTTIRTGLALWEQRGRLEKPLLALRRRFARGSLAIAVFGAGGVGKTTLGSWLAGELNTEEPPPDYRESIGPETYWLKSNPAQSVIVAPGQEVRVRNYWPDIYDRLRQTRRALVINVVAYGYHSVNEAVTLPTDAALMETYVSKRRKQEIELAGEIAGVLSRTTGPLKMLTVCLKQDLWWTEQEKVKHHYEQGEYAKHLEQIREAKGTQNFVHEFAYVSLCLQNLRSAAGEVMIPTASGYEDAMRIEGQTDLLQRIKELTK